MSFENSNSWFENELRLPVPEKGVDYSFAEAKLLRRIRECEELGSLSLLRLEEIPTGAKFEQIERDLFTQVTHYSEYDEPMEECLRASNDLTEKEWRRIAAKLYERLQPVVKLPFWEQHVMAPCREPTVGHWEAMESVLFDRIVRCDELQPESWARCESTDDPAPEQALEHAEVLLDAHIVAASSKSLWEQVVSAEVIPSFSAWERIEENLFSAIEIPQQLDVRMQPFWYIVEHYQAVLKAAGVIAAAAIIAIGVATSSLLQNDADLESTVMYRLEGTAARSADTNPVVGNRFSMIDGGSATLVNSHGSIEVYNSATVDFKSISKSRAHYRVDFMSSRNSGAQGQVAFFVRPHKKNKSFSVTTRDYRIAVTGTYFRVEADLAGRAATRVLEGTIRITDSPIGDTVLRAGQSLQYDPSIQHYRIFNGGPVVERSDIEQFPAVEELALYRTVALSSSEAGADVRLDGKYCGTTPLTIRLPAGAHTVRIEKAGYVAVDSTFILAAATRGDRLAFALKRRHDDVIMEPLSLIADNTDESGYQDRNRTAGNRNLPGKTGLSAILYDQARSAERAEDWRKAVRLYRKVLTDPALSPLRREDAMFSVAKILAERGSDVEQAKESFLTYLAMFPAGSFAGESWLRLAELEFRTNPEHAIQYYLKYFEMFPRHPRIAELQDRVGVIYLQQKRFDKAIGMFEQALAHNTASGAAEQYNIATHLYRALLADGETRRAESVRTRYQVSERE